MAKNFCVTIAAQDDLPALQAILQSSSRDWNADILQSFLGEEYLSWVIRVDKKICGFVIVRHLIDFWEILQIVIDHSCQQQGLGSQLLRFVLQKARDNKINKIILEVRQSNIAAIALYRHCDFQQVGVRKKYYADGENAFVMEKII